MIRILLTALLALTLVGIGCKKDGEDKKDKKGDTKVELCKKAQANMMKFAKEMLKDMPEEMRVKAEKRMEKDMAGDDFLKECQKQSDESIKCAAGAKDMGAMEKCMRDSDEKDDEGDKEPADEEPAEKE